ncbi:MAG TPA: hypothetical protein VLR26_03230 [Frankiaceae bacterium]|nr:hypothetical protein [Frankiaceae bacterium]
MVVRRYEDRTTISALDPQVIVSLPDNPDLQPVADEAGRRLRSALAALQPNHHGAGGG